MIITSVSERRPTRDAMKRRNRRKEEEKRTFLLLLGKDKKFLIRILIRFWVCVASTLRRGLKSCKVSHYRLQVPLIDQRSRFQWNNGLSPVFFPLLPFKEQHFIFLLLIFCQVCFLFLSTYKEFYFYLFFIALNKVDKLSLDHHNLFHVGQVW
jgi:hypothetical protein